MDIYKEGPGSQSYQSLVTGRPEDQIGRSVLDQLEKITEDLRKNYRNEDPDPVLAEKTEQLSRLIAELRKNYRQDDDVGLDLRPHINRNSVTAGELTRPIGQMTSAVQCSEINGETVCTRKTSSCQNSFGIGCTDSEKSTQNRYFCTKIVYFQTFFR